MSSPHFHVIDYLLRENQSIPNNEKLPLLLYQQAVLSSDADPASRFEKLFEKNSWTNSWRNGVYAYHHYHSSSHEVLGCYSGTATLQFGGDTGIIEQIQAGDVVIIPAGVAHKRLSASPDFRVVGAYPVGQQPDMNQEKSTDPSSVKKNIEAVPLPNSDPVCGSDGPLVKLWG